MTERRMQELKKRGIEVEKIEERAMQIITDLSNEGYSIEESKVLMSTLDHILYKAEKRSPETKLSDAVHVDSLSAQH